jgi:osmoprotectant transport system permease protein
MFPPERTFWELFVTYVSGNWPRILALTGQHVMISGIAICITLLICIPLGIVLTKREKLASVVIGVANVFQTIPSLALLGFLIFVFVSVTTMPSALSCSTRCFRCCRTPTRGCATSLPS